MYWSPSKWDEATSIQEIGRTEWHRCPLWWPSMCKRWFTHISLLGLWWWNDYGYMRNINQQTIGYINMYIYNTYICTYIYIYLLLSLVALMFLLFQYTSRDRWASPCRLLPVRSFYVLHNTARDSCLRAEAKRAKLCQRKDVADPEDIVAVYCNYQGILK